MVFKTYLFKGQLRRKCKLLSHERALKVLKSITVIGLNYFTSKCIFREKVRELEFLLMSA